MEKAIFTYVVFKHQIEAKNINPILKAITDLEQQKEHDVFRSLAIVIDGYNDSPEELWEVKEVRAWFQKLMNKVPHVLYFIENDFAQTEQTVMLSINDFIYMHETDRKPISEFAPGEELPIYGIHIKVHQKSYREMCSALRKYAKKRQDVRRVEELIEEMNERYGVDE